MNLSEQLEDAKLELQISPLIDVVFLLLIYFIVTAQIVKIEGDIPFMLPADVPQVEMIDIPIDARINILEDDSVMLDGMSFSGTDRKLEGLVSQIVGLRQMAEAQRSPFFVTLAPQPDTQHYRIIDVMDACADAGVKKLGFSKAL